MLANLTLKSGLIDENPSGRKLAWVVSLKYSTKFKCIKSIFYMGRIVAQMLTTGYMFSRFKSLQLKSIAINNVIFSCFFFNRLV